MGGRRKKRGILTGLARPGYSQKPKRPASAVRRVLNWIGGAVILAAFGVMLWALLAQMFDPRIGDRPAEGVFVISEIREEAGTFPPEARAVATAVVTISGRATLVPLTAEERRSLRTGDAIRVRYTDLPRLGILQVDSWERVE